MSCAVVGCKTRWKKNDPTTILFRFPPDKDLRQKWIAALPRESPDGKNKSWEPSAFSKLCIKHFLPEDIDPYSPFRTRLKKDAVPSIFHTHKISKKSTTPVDTQARLEIIRHSPSVTNVNKVSSMKELLKQKDEEINDLREQLKAKDDELEQKVIEVKKKDEELINLKIVEFKKYENLEKLIAVDLKKKDELLKVEMKNKDRELEKLRKLIESKNAINVRQRKEMKRLHSAKQYLQKKVASMEELLVKEFEKRILERESCLVEEISPPSSPEEHIVEIQDV